MTWTFVKKLEKGGHRLFKDEAGHYAIADQSGATPDRTDDGVLYIDTTRPVMISNGRNEGLTAIVPLTRGDGVPSDSCTTMGMEALANLVHEVPLLVINFGSSLDPLRLLLLRQPEILLDPEATHGTQGRLGLLLEIEEAAGHICALPLDAVEGPEAALERATAWHKLRQLLLLSLDMTLARSP